MLISRSHQAQDIVAEEAARDWGAQAAAQINQLRRRLAEAKQETVEIEQDLEDAIGENASVEERLELSTSLRERQ